MIWIALAIFSVFSAIILLAACKAASLADQQAEAAFADWMERQSDKK